MTTGRVAAHPCHWDGRVVGRCLVAGQRENGIMGWEDRLELKVERMLQEQEEARIRLDAATAKAQAAVDARDRLLEANAQMLHALLYKTGAMHAGLLPVTRSAMQAIDDLRQAAGRDADGIRPLAEKGVSPDPKAN